MIKQEQPLKNKKAVNIANKMGKRYTLLDAMLMGKKLKIDWKKEKFGIGDLLVGMHYELEHGKVDASTNVTDDNAIKTAKIAWAHLKERPDYYVQLMKIDPPKKMEKKASEMLEDMVFEKEAKLSDDYLIEQYGLKLKEMSNPAYDMSPDDYAKHIELSDKERAEGNKVRAAASLDSLKILKDRRKKAIKQLPKSVLATGAGVAGLGMSWKYPGMGCFTGPPSLAAAVLGAAIASENIGDIKRGSKKGFRQIKSRHIAEAAKYGVTPENYKNILLDSEKNFKKLDKKERDRYWAAYRAGEMNAVDRNFYFTETPKHLSRHTDIVSSRGA